MIRAMAIAFLLTLTLTAAATDTGKEHPQPITIALYQNIPDPGIDPHFTYSFIASNVVHHFYEGLVALDADGELTPNLAIRWQQRKDHVTRFFLRRGVRFHDGRLFSEKDVLASLDRASSPQSAFRNRLSQVISWSSPNPGIVDIKTDGPAPLFLKSLATIMMAPHDTPSVVEQPIGTGPYKWVAAQSQESLGRLQLEASTEHWSGHKVPQRVAFVFEPDHQRRAELLVKGEVDLVAALQARHQEMVESSSDLWIESRLGSKVVALEMRVDKGLFSDPRLRKAMDLLFDRKSIAEKVFLRMAKPAGQLTSPGVFGFDPNIPVTERNLKSARDLLAAAKLKTGTEIELHGPEAQAHLCQELKRQAAEAGLTLSIRLHPNKVYYQTIERLRPGLFVALWSNSLMDAGWLFKAKIHSTTSAGLGDTNRNGFSHPQIDTLILQAMSITGAPERQEALRQIARRVAQEKPILPLVWTMNLYGIRRTLEWHPRLDGRVYAYEIGQP